MMWGVLLLLFSCVQAQAMSHGISVTCGRAHGYPPTSEISPSFLADLNVMPVTVGHDDMLNISWSVNFDVSVKYLTGTRIRISGHSTYLCEYNPHLAANIPGPEQRWFHYLVDARCDVLINIEATNLPLPQQGSDSSYKVKRIMIPCKPESSTSVSTASTSDSTDVPPVTPPSPLRIEHVAVAIFGGLVALMILTLCFLIYKCCGANIATLFGFKRLPQSPKVPVPILVVYPAQNSAFQQAVVALAEFLQWHGGCRVAIDMWQLGRIAELGPMRWLAEQVKSSDHVLIVCPQASSLPNHSPPSRSFPEPSVPAAAHDLYPLILNMVASHASTSDLAKFRVVQLGEQHDKRHGNVSLELRACKSFCLMKDLNKLCRSLHTHRQDNTKIADLSLRSEISFSEKSTGKLREAVEKLLQRRETTKKCGHLCLSISDEHV